MGIIRGLGNINARIDSEEAKHNGEGAAKTQWFKLKDKESVKVVFLQELDEESKNYSEKNGLGFIAVEHSNPDDFKRKALCTMEDEGACWACEENRRRWQSDPDNYKGGFKQRSRLYINVLVDNGSDDPYVAVLSQGLSGKQVTPALIEQAGEFGSITDRHFKIKRNGASFNDTSYLLTALAEHDLNVEDYQVFDLDKVVRQVPYAQQEAHYLGGQESDDSFAPKAAAPVASDEW